MMLKDDFKKCLEIRLQVPAEDDVSTQKCWNDEIMLLSRNIDETVAFIKSCSDEELYWMSEVFEEIFNTAEGEKIIAAVKERVETVNNQMYAISIQKEIEYSES